MTIDEASRISLRRAWAALPPRLTILEPMAFSREHWSLIERMHANFNDYGAHTRLPIPIARFREEVTKGIYEETEKFNDVETIVVDNNWCMSKDSVYYNDIMASYARLFNEEVDELMRIIVPSARYRKGHYAYGKFTVAAPHGLHTDHSAEDPDSTGEPICIARIQTLGTHYVAGSTHDARTERMLKALRYWTAVPEGEPEDVLDELLKQGALRTIPVNHVMLMVAGNSSANTRITPHIAARPPEGGQHSAFFQRQYKLT